MSLRSLVEELEKSQWIKKDRPLLKGPILSRYDLQTMKAPRGDFVARTSGATGVPIEVQRTYLSRLWWNATNLREAVWHRRDISQSFAIIRPSVLRKETQPNWGPSFALLGKTGPLYAHPVRGDLNKWLEKIQPGYLMTFPSILQTLDLSLLSHLKGIKTTGEMVYEKHPLVRDMYSCEEVGTIAIECPDVPETYHVMENIFVEILDDKDKPADMGRVVLTDLTSHYLYRYDIGDIAEIGSQCPCGRGLQTIKKIKGRRRNHVLLPDGSLHWPAIGYMEYRNIAPIKRYQLAQTERTTIEFRLIIDTPLTEAQTKALTTTIQNAIGYPFDIRFVYVDTFSSDKYEEFINEISR